MQIKLHFLPISSVQIETVFEQWFDCRSRTGPHSFSSVVRNVSPAGTNQFICDLQ